MLARLIDFKFPARRSPPDSLATSNRPNWFRSRLVVLIAWDSRDFRTFTDRIDGTGALQGQPSGAALADCGIRRLEAIIPKFGPG
jgi:hypothetical protein